MYCVPFSQRPVLAVFRGFFVENLYAVVVEADQERSSRAVD